jgi:hypothetical protein
MWWCEGFYGNRYDGNSSFNTGMGWWNGFYGGKRQVNIQTGYYGLAVDAVAGGIVRLGALTEIVSESEAQYMDNSLIDNLPEIEMDYSVAYGGHVFNFLEVDANEGGNNATRILESGRYMQRLDLMYLTFSGNNNLLGRMEAACMPEFFSITFEVHSKIEVNNAKLTFSITLPESYSNRESSLNGRALTITGPEQTGLTFMIPSGSNTVISNDGKKILFTASGINIPAGKFSGFSVIVIPSENASTEDALLHDARENVTVSAVQVSPVKGRVQNSENLTSTGYKSVSLDGMVTDCQAVELQNNYDQVTFTLTNHSNKTIRVPIQFVKNNPLPVTGMSPFLRDTQTGEPIGVQVQLTKNWHNYSVENNGVSSSRLSDDPARNWEGTWFHGYTLIEVPAGQSVSYDYACAFARYGNVFAVSHAQLCLVGWGGHQLWETAALGSFGESFCYDANKAWTHSFLGDICPALITSRINNEQYNWTINVGAADFLVYHNSDTTRHIPNARMRTRYKKQGPVVTEVIYTGITADSTIDMEYKAEMPRTDDASKVFHSFRYVFLKDVNFSRLAFYQFGADEYNVGIYKTMAIGNDNGPVSFKLGGSTFGNEFPVPEVAANEYYKSREMQRIEIPDKGMWFAFLGGQARMGETGAGANKVLTLINYKAEINGTHYDKPAFNIRTTNTFQQSALIELCPPAAVGNIIKAGSVVEGTVAFINLPAKKTDYYGPSKVLNLIPPNDFTTWKLSHLYAMQTKMTVTAALGEVKRNMPCVVRSTSGNSGVVCEFTVNGGISYVPVTITSLPEYADWQLQELLGNEWVNIDQHYHGSDWWQAWYDAETNSYELSFTLPHNGKNDIITYRLIKKPNFHQIHRSTG